MKNAKNWIWYCVLLLMAVFFSSCAEEESVGSIDLTAEPELLGKWNLIEVSGNWNVSTTSIPRGSVIWDFRSNDSIYIDLFLEENHSIYPFLSLFDEQIPYMEHDMLLSAPSFSEGLAPDLWIGEDAYRILSWGDAKVDLENVSAHQEFILSFIR